MSNPASIAAANATSEFQLSPPDSQALSDATFQLPGDPITVADQTATGATVDAILGATPGLTIDYNSIVIIGGPTSVGYYDGTLSALGIGAGLLITSGTMPGTSNTVGWFGIDNGMNGDPALDAVINPIFATNSYDATSITFDFTVTDPSITGISFNIVFGTDEYPEWVDQFVDIAVILINGVNVAYFGNDPNAPLSVISQNLAAGYFLNNGSGALPIEYDGVSNVLTVFAPVTLGLNTITIAIADTGDHIYDSGLFISGLQGVTLPATGVSQDVPCTEGDDDLVGSNSSESFNGLGGDDTLDGGGGDDVIQGGAGADDILGGAGHDVLDGGEGHDIVNGGDGDDLISFSGDDAIDGGAGDDQVLIDLSASTIGETLDFSSASPQVLSDGSSFVNVEQLVFTGGSGADTITGGALADVISGGDGDDVLAGGGGGDTLDGGAGADTAVFTGVSTDYLITGGANGSLVVEDLRPGSPDGITTLIGIETVQFSNGVFDPTPLVSHGETIIGGAADDVINGAVTVPGQGFATDFGDIITTGDGDDIVDSLGGNDVVNLGMQNDILHAGAGDDTITGGEGDDEIWGDEGTDTAIFTGNWADYLIIEQGDGYRITDLRLGSPDGQDQLVSVEYAQFADGTVKLTIGSPVEIGAGVTEAQVVEPVSAAGVTTVNGAFDFLDLDHDDTHTVSVVASSGDQTGVTFGASMSYDTNGEDPGSVGWSVQVDTAVIQTLGAGQVRTLTYTLRITDSAGNEPDQVVTVEIVGTNDAPIITVAAATSVASDGGPVSVDALAQVSDTDLGAKPHVAAIPILPAGVTFDAVAQTFTIDPLDPDLIAQTGGSDSIVVVDYVITDGFIEVPASITFNVGGSGVNIIGTIGADLIDATHAPAGQPFPSAGGDFINGRAGDDTISGLDGNDHLVGESGMDTIWGGAGNDIIDGGTRVDTLNGGDGDDTFIVNGLEAVQDVIDGGSGGETLGDAIEVEGTSDVTLAGFNAAASGIERWIGNGTGLFGRAGSETFNLSGLTEISGLAFVDAAAGNDTLIGSQFGDDLRGGSGNDTLTGGGGLDVLSGGGGNDTFYVDDTGDQVVELLNGGTDRVFTTVDFALGANIETIAIQGAVGRNITGNGLANTMTGGTGGDTLSGGDGNDALSGGDGDDVLIGGAGNDTLTGGAGLDTADFTGAASAITVSLSTSAIQNTGGGGADRLLGVENLTGSAYGDTLTGSLGANVISGADGADVLNGRDGDDTLIGGEGDDRMNGGAGADAFDGGNGSDMVDYRTAAGAVTLDLTTGIHTGEALGDTFTSVERWLLSNAGDSFFGTAAAEQVDGYDGDDVINGGGGVDSLRGLNGADTLNGDDGNDTLQGGAGNDVMSGGNGFDKLYGDAGDDTLTGGADAGDQFIWSSNSNLGSDHVTDFQDGLDKIRLVGTGATQFSDLLISTNGSGWVVITLANGTVITLDGVLATSVDASDFLWG